LFGIAADGRLGFVRKYDVDLGGKFQWWTGFWGFRRPDNGAGFSTSWRHEVA